MIIVTHSCVSLQDVLVVELYLIAMESGSTPMEVQCQSLAQEIVFTETEEMMELFGFIGGPLLHCQLQWANTAAKSPNTNDITHRLCVHFSKLN